MLKEGKPLTVTEPAMTRFIMSLEEAVELVVFTFEKGHSGDIMVQKAPACTLEVLATAVKELFQQRGGWIVPAAAGVLVGAVWNYALTALYTWKPPARRRAGGLQRRPPLTRQASAPPGPS